MPHSPLKNPSLLSSYLGGTNGGHNCDHKSSNCTAISLVQQTANMYMQQMAAHPQEPIFERPLDPYLQEGLDSNLPTGAKMSIVTSDSNVIREE